MGDRITIYNKLKCAYCGKEQEEVYFAESSGVTMHVCAFCRRKNRIVEEFHLSKI